jgi:hypothetical protein
LADLGVLKELHAKVAPILSVLNLGSEGIRYFAGSVARMRTTNPFMHQSRLPRLFLHQGHSINSQCKSTIGVIHDDGLA